MLGQPTSETELMNGIIELLLYNGIYCWRNNNVPVFDTNTGAYRRMPRHSPKGISDICGVLPDGKALFIEVKSEKGRLSQYQEHFFSKVQEVNAVAFVAKSYKDVEDQLKIYLCK